MTILLGKGNQVYYYFGQLEADKISEEFKSTSFKEIRKLILDKKKATPIDDLMYIIKSDSTSTFANSIDILDEMTINNVRTYAILKPNDPVDSLVCLKIGQSRK